jgi:PIN domain
MVQGWVHGFGSGSRGSGVQTLTCRAAPSGHVPRTLRSDLLDTNVVSELMRQAPEPDVVRWTDSFSAAEIFLTAVTAAELMYGVARLPNGRAGVSSTQRSEDSWRRISETRFCHSMCYPQ